MSRPRSLNWWITNYDGWWWQGRRWTKEPDAKRICSNVAHATTKRKALRIANKCPAEMTLIHFKYGHGKRRAQKFTLKCQTNF